MFATLHEDGNNRIDYQELYRKIRSHCSPNTSKPAKGIGQYKSGSQTRSPSRSPPPHQLTGTEQASDNTLTELRSHLSNLDQLLGPNAPATELPQQLSAGRSPTGSSNAGDKGKNSSFQDHDGYETGMSLRRRLAELDLEMNALAQTPPTRPVSDKKVDDGNEGAQDPLEARAWRMAAASFSPPK